VLADIWINHLNIMNIEYDMRTNWELVEA
jgi:hypothetical protein